MISNSATTLRRSLETTHGAFFPHLYAIGTLGDELPNTDTITSFLEKRSTSDHETEHSLLVFVHEATHLVQFLSTTFGLSAARSADFLVSHMLKNTSQSFPRTVKFDDTKPTLGLTGEMQYVVLRYWEMQYFFDEELNIREIEYKRNELVSIPENSYAVIGYPLTMAEFTRVSTNLEDKIRLSNGRQLTTYWATRAKSDQIEVSCKLNAAALFETAAVISELYIIGNRRSQAMEINEVWKHIDGLPDRYKLVFYIYRDHYRLNEQLMLPQLCALIDLCLMQDGYILERSYVFDKSDGEKNPYITQGALLFKVFEAAGQVEDFCISSDDIVQQIDESFLSNLQDYQDRVADAAGLVRTDEMLQRSIDFLEKETTLQTWKADAKLKNIPYIASIDFRHGYLLHYKILKMRQKIRCGFLISSGIDFLLAAFEVIKKDVQHINLRDSEVSKMSVTTHPFLVQACVRELLATTSKICPFQRGRPFFCETAFKFERYCAAEYSNGDLTYCPFYYMASFFEDCEEIGLVKRLGLRPDIVVV